jgi:hypothetical protein
MGIQFAGDFEMKRLIGIVFQYEDGTTDVVEDPRACLLFQSRCNKSGILSGLETYIKPLQEDGSVKQTV